MSTTTPTEYLTPKEVAAMLKVSTDTLEGWRSKRTGPPWTRLGDGDRSPVRYRREDVEAYLKARQQ